MTRLDVGYRVRALARRFGVELGRTAALPNQALYTKALLERYQVSVVLDVGARVGEFGTWLRRNGYGGRIVSFEPVGHNFEQLAELASADPRWDVHRLALGSEDTEAEINVTASSNFSSFLAPNEYAEATFGADTAIEARETVPVRRLDNLWGDLGLAAADRIYLKMDTQGWDLEVLSGAGERMDAVVALQSEASVRPIYGGMATFTESIERIIGDEFSIAGLYPVSVDDALRVIEFDLIAVRADAVAD